jgi:hypothetical protein
MITEKEFNSWFDLMRAALPRYAPENNATIRAIWYELFKDCSPTILRYLMQASLATKDAFPSVKELREMIEGNAEKDAPEAAEKLYAGVARFGSQLSRYETEIKPWLGKNAASLCERLGGWLAVCEMTDGPEKTTLVAQWRELYKSAAQHARAQSLMPPEVKSQIEGLADRFSLTPALPTRQNK